MRPGRNRLPPLVSTRDRRCSRFVSELGLEIFRHDRLVDREAVEADQRISSRQTRSLFAPAAALPPRQHFVFLRGELQRARDSTPAWKNRRGTSRRGRGRDQQGSTGNRKGTG